MPNRVQAKAALDAVIKKSRVHLYKPIQIAEILYRDRVFQDIDLLELEDYRTKSKRWRDDVCQVLLGRVCTSSAKFQDDLFNETAIPPVLINELGKENRRTNGGVEAYIYSRFTNKHGQLASALDYCLMYSNWGPAIQIKHLSLDVELAKNIVDSVSSDKVVIVCKDAERDVIVSLLTQIGWRNHIQSIVTESNLICWYEKALRGKYAEQIGDELIIRLCGEIAEEFPSVDTIPDIIKNRHYEKVETDDFWKAVE